MQQCTTCDDECYSLRSLEEKLKTRIVFLLLREDSVVVLGGRILLPAKVSTSVAKRKTRRGPGPRGTRVGSICLEAPAPRAAPASDARVPRFVTDRRTPLILVLSASSRRGRPHLTLPRRRSVTRRIDRYGEPPPPLADAADIHLITPTYPYRVFRTTKCTIEALYTYEGLRAMTAN